MASVIRSTEIGIDSLSTFSKRQIGWALELELV